MELIVRRFADGYTLADILDDYPQLTAENVQAALVRGRCSRPATEIGGQPPAGSVHVIEPGRIRARLS